MLLVTNEFYLFSKSRLSRDLHLERLDVVASFQTHGHLCFMTFACVPPGTCLPPKASLTKLYSCLRPLGSRSQVRQVFPAHAQSRLSLPANLFHGFPPFS